MKVLQFGYSEQKSLLQQLCRSFGCPTIRCYSLEKSKCSLYASTSITQELYKELNHCNHHNSVNQYSFVFVSSIKKVNEKEEVETQDKKRKVFLTVVLETSKNLILDLFKTFQEIYRQAYWLTIVITTNLNSYPYME